MYSRRIDTPGDFSRERAQRATSGVVGSVRPGDQSAFECPRALPLEERGPGPPGTAGLAKGGLRCSNPRFLIFFGNSVEPRWLLSVLKENTVSTVFPHLRYLKKEKKT